MINNQGWVGGRPSKYKNMLEQIASRNFIGWYVINDNMKTRNAPSSMRKRYPGFDFKATEKEDGTFILEARKM